MKKSFLFILLAAIIVTVLAGCGGSAQTEESDSSDTTVYGRVTAINGNVITIEVYNMPQGGNVSGRGQGQARPDTSGIPEGGQAPDTSGSSGGGQGENRPDTSGMPEGGQAPDVSGMPDRGQGRGDGAFGATGTGEEKTITVLDDTVITKGGMGQGENASLSDITVGSMVSVSLSGDNAVSVTIIQFQNREDAAASAESSK